jgi:prepilin-type processing-associated H-X9-DG protein
MIDWPATYHGVAGAVAFADGHVEMHLWRDPRTVLEVPHPGVVSQPGSADVRWIAEHATALIAAPEE